MLCLGLLVMFCDAPKPSAIDSYCQSYQRIIRLPADSAINAPLSVKQRIAANEITYRCTCEGWGSPLCHAKPK